MASGLLSLKWNNHKSTFFHVLSTIRSKEAYCDVTLACDGRFYSLHKFVLSTCSEYFEEMFERTQCKHPVIVLKDIKYDDLEALLNYMYVGEVNVVQEKLSGLIKAAECLKIKGLAVPDEDPREEQESVTKAREQNKRTQRSDDSPRPKRRRRENSSEVGEEILSPVRSRTRTRDHQAAKSNVASSEESRQQDGRGEDGQDDAHEEAENSSINANRQTDSSTSKNKSSSHKKEPVPEEVVLEDDVVKAEPVDPDTDTDTGGGEAGGGGADEEDQLDNKDTLHHELGFDASDSMGGDDDNYGDLDSAMMDEHVQTVADVVAQALPGSSGFQGGSYQIWDGDSSLANFSVDGLSEDNTEGGQQMVTGWQNVPSVPSIFPQPLPQVTQRHMPDQYSMLASGSSALLDAAVIPFHLLNFDLARATTPNKRYRCPICGKEFYDKSHFRNHYRIHTGDKPFKCPHCPYDCRESSNMKKHVWTKHPDKRRP